MDNKQKDMLSDIDRIFILKSIEMFRELPIETLYEILKIAVTRKYSKGQILMKKGDAGDSFFVVISGSLGVYPTQNQEPIAVIKNGGIIGELAIINKQKRTATIIPLEECILLEFNGDEFIQLLKKNGSISLSVIKTLVFRLRGMLEKN